MAADRGGVAALRIEIDDTRRVTGVVVRDADAVATPEALDAAVAAGYSEALAEAAASRRVDRPRTGARPVAVATLIEKAPPPPGSYDRHRIREEGRHTRALRRGEPGTAVGISTNECVTVRLRPASSFGSVESDAGWLRTARPDSIERAVTEAFAAAYDRRDG